MPLRLTGLVAATFTPLKADGGLDLDRVGPIVEHLLADGVSALYGVGSTGEGVSLTTEERQDVAQAFVAATAGRCPVVIQVGHNSLAEARRLAAHAQKIGAAAISATPPAYFKPESMDVLVRSLREITAGAPDLPFYYYHIPAKTGVALDMVRLLEEAPAALPTLSGIKFTSPAVHEFQACLGVDNGRFDMLWGLDEMLLPAWSVGARGAVGTTYNFAAPIYRAVIRACEDGDPARAALWQSRAVEMVRCLLSPPGGIPAFKAVMSLLDLDCGPTRLPLPPLDELQVRRLDEALRRIGFFDWRRQAVDALAKA